jgi:hypothetical protein
MCMTKALAVAALLGAGCSGAILEGDPAGGGTTPGDPSGAVAPGAPPVAGFSPGPATLRRLTRVQYANAIRDLLGPDITVPGDFEPDTVLSGFASIGSSLTTVSATAAEKFESAASAIATQAIADPARRGRLVTCAPTATVDESCARTFVTDFGRRAWRRPLSAEEVGRYAAIATQGATMLGDFWKGLSYALAGLLQSPNFLYRIEVGRTGVVAGQRVFDGWELASRLSFFLANSTPDDTLLDAAGSGALSRPGGLRQAAERLLDSPRGKAVFRNFFYELMRLDGLDDLEQSPVNFPKATRTIGPAMREETLRLIEEIALAPDGDYRRVFDADFTFVNRELGQLYGLPAPGDAFVRAPLPGDGLRLGLLGHASFLASNAHEATTSPTRRGKFVREVILCHEIPAPPPDVDASLPEEKPGDGPRTMRERLSGHNAPACTACHARMDPLGLAFENFDALGAYRARDAGKEIDASGDLDGQRFAGPRELAALLRTHPDVEPCLVRGLYRYALGHLETAGEEVLIQRIGAGLTGNKLRSALLGIVESDGFRLAADLP